MKKPFQIVIGSPVDYEELVAYIAIDGQYIALLNQDDGKDNIKIEFSEEPPIKVLDLDIFMAALVEAKRALMK